MRAKLKQSEKFVPVYEYWHDEGRDIKFRRCSCWQRMRFATSEGMMIAVNNGWSPIDRAYPHARYCNGGGG